MAYSIRDQARYFRRVLQGLSVELVKHFWHSTKQNEDLSLAHSVNKVYDHCTVHIVLTFIYTVLP